MLELGKLSAHPYESIPGGLDGVQEGLKKLKDGNMFRTSDTAGLCQNMCIVDSISDQTTSSNTWKSPMFVFAGIL